MTEYVVGQRIRAYYYTSVYKSAIEGWRSEYVDAELEVISPKMARVTRATMEQASSKRQRFNVSYAESNELGSRKIISKLHGVEVIE